MKKLILFFIVLIAFSACAQQKKMVEFNVTYSNRYCGGARPNPELLKKEKERYPFVLSTIKLIAVKEDSSQKKAKAYILKLNNSGRGKLSIKPGNYEIFLGNKIGKQLQSINLNSNCPPSFARSYGNIEINADNTQPLEVNLVFPCDPCDPNNGKRQ